MPAAVRSRYVVMTVCGVLGATGVAGAHGADGPVAARRAPGFEQRTIETSVRGLPIRARVIGDPAAERSVLIVGCIHGTERAGEAVTRHVRAIEEL